MSFTEQVKKATGKVSDIRRPRAEELAALVNRRTPQLYRFGADGKVPNNAVLPVVHYRAALCNRDGLDPAALCEDLFAFRGWADSWRNGIYPFVHFHTRDHEVLGIARGSAEVQFGGSKGRAVRVQTGDVVVLPAGTGHRRLSASRDLLVVGAYPKGSDYDQQRPGEIKPAEASQLITAVPTPPQDPVYGPNGPLTELWRGRQICALAHSCKKQ